MGPPSPYKLPYGDTPRCSSALRRAARAGDLGFESVRAPVKVARLESTAAAREASAAPLPLESWRRARRSRVTPSGVGAALKRRTHTTVGVGAGRFLMATGVNNRLQRLSTPSQRTENAREFPGLLRVGGALGVQVHPNPAPAGSLALTYDMME